MNSPDPDPALTSWAEKVPRPVLRDEARHRSLDAALAAVEAPLRTKPRPVSRRRISAHWIGWAACWAVTGGLWWSTPRPPASKNGPPAGFAGWQSPLGAPPQDEETAQLLANFYSARPAPPSSFHRSP